jgi:hypothetical protein
VSEFGFYFAIVIDVLIIVFGLYFGYRSFKTNLEGEYSGRRGAKSALLFSIGLVLVTLGFSLIVMTTDRTQIGEYMAALIMLEMLFGLVVFVIYFSSQFLLTKVMNLFRRNKSQKS